MTATVQSDTWDADVADAIVKAVMARKTLADPMLGRDERSEWWHLCDLLDDSFLRRDFAALNRAAGEAVAFLETLYPRTVGKLVQYEPPEAGDTWAGWVRIKGRKWVAVVKDCTSKADLDEFMGEFGKAHRLFTTAVLPSGRRPGE